MSFTPPTLIDTLAVVCGVNGYDEMRVLRRHGPAFRDALLQAEAAASCSEGVAILIDRLGPMVPRDAHLVLESLIRPAVAQSGGTWRTGELQTSIWIKAALAAGIGIGEIRAWAARQVREPPPDRPLNVSQWQHRLSSAGRDPDLSLVTDYDADGDVPLLFVSAPVAKAEGAPLVLAESFRHSVARALAAVLERRGAGPVQLAFPALEYFREKDRGMPDDPSRWAAVSRRVAPRCDALILTDLSHQPPGWGSRSELALQAWPPRPGLRLYEREPRSLLEIAQVEQLPIAVQVASPAEVGGVTAAWFDANYLEMLSARRRRQNELVAARPEQHEFERLIATASGEQVQRALIASQISGERLRRLLDDEYEWLRLTHAERDALFRQLRAVPRGRRRSGRAQRPASMPASLAEARRLEGWSIADAWRLYDRAREERARVGTADRLPLSTASDWIALERRFRGNP